MIIVDSSVWIDYFNLKSTPQTDILQDLLGSQMLGIGDIILTEVLQGFKSDRDFRLAQTRMAAFHAFEMLGVDNAIRSARNYRRLRKRGITIRKTTDVIIATFCIRSNHELLYADADFEPFVEHLGLASVR